VKARWTFLERESLKISALSGDRGYVRSPSNQC
jgi:hypothetical protein